MGPLLLAAANLLFPVIAAGYLLFFFLSPRRNLLSKLRQELPERFCLPGSETINAFAGKDGIWIHAASVGEARSISLLAEKIKTVFPGRPLLITSSTWAGREAAEKIAGKGLAVLAPLDFYPFASRFISLFKPSCLLIVENELWPNMITAAGNAGIPIGIINGRISEKSARRYQLIKPLMEMMLSKVTFACLQSYEITKRYESLGLVSGETTGNIKYDTLSATAPKAAEIGSILKSLGWEKSRLIVCGSTHPQEEEMLRKAIPEIIKACPEARFIAAPRHSERRKAVMLGFEIAEIPHAALSTATEAKPGALCLIADQMGWLNSFYADAEICFVGGTIAKKGGHNLLEPAVFKKPVLFGPHTYNTPDVAAELSARGGGFEITEGNFASTIIKLLSDTGAATSAGQKAFETAEHFKGATERTFAKIKAGIK